MTKKPTQIVVQGLKNSSDNNSHSEWLFSISKLFKIRNLKWNNIILFILLCSIFIWFLTDFHMILTGFIWFLTGFYMIFWLVFIWFSTGLVWFFDWFLYDFWLIFIWFLTGFYMVFDWFCLKWQLIDAFCISVAAKQKSLDQSRFSKNISISKHIITMITLAACGGTGRGL